MLTPEKFDKLTNNEVVEEYEKLNQELINEIITLIMSYDNITNNLIKIDSKSVLKKSQLKTIGKTKKVKQQLTKIFKKLVNYQMDGYDDIYKSKGLEFEIAPSIKKIVNSSIRLVKNDLNKLNKAISYNTKIEYQNAMNELYKNIKSGKVSSNVAINNTIDKLSKRGITFTTRNGRHERIETVVKRTIHDKIKSTADEIAKKIGNDIDFNCVKIGHSNKCRPTHHPIDDVTMSKDMFKEYEPLTDEYNCNHIVNYLWLEEFENTNNKAIYGHEHGTLSEVKRNYEIQQKLNYLKRQVKLKKNAIDSGNNSVKAKRELRNAKSKLKLGLSLSQSGNAIKLTKGSEFMYKGNKYIVDGKNVKNEFSKKEIDFANWLSKNQFKEVILIPKINKPDGIKVPDLKIDNEYYDMKIITGNSKQVIYHNVYGKQEQANNFLFETSNSSLSIEDLIEQVNKVFKRTDVPHVKKIGIKKDSNFIIIKKE